MDKATKWVLVVIGIVTAGICTYKYFQEYDSKVLIGTFLGVSLIVLPFISKDKSK